MIKKLAYQFDSAQVATRFLNALKAGAIENVQARRYIGSESIIVSYGFDESSGFDPTCAELDALAEAHGGEEIDV